MAVTKADAIAEKAKQLKMSKYAHLDTACRFVTVAIETSGSLGLQSLHIVVDFSRRLRSATVEPKSSQ